MTPEEAMKLIDIDGSIKHLEECERFAVFAKKENEAKMLKEIIEAFTIISKALEKQIPKELSCSEKILKTEYSPKFDELRKNRMIQSFYKYGPASKNYGEGRVDAIGSLELCLEKFKKTGNTEYLVDVANYAMLRYMHPLPGEYFEATGSKDSAGTVGTSINFEK
jgi:hypothetical protein